MPAWQPMNSHGVRNKNSLLENAKVPPQSRQTLRVLALISLCLLTGWRHCDSGTPDQGPPVLTNSASVLRWYNGYLFEFGMQHTQCFQNAGVTGTEAARTAILQQMQGCPAPPPAPPPCTELNCPPAPSASPGDYEIPPLITPLTRITTETTSVATDLGAMVQGEFNKVRSSLPAEKAALLEGWSLNIQSCSDGDHILWIARHNNDGPGGAICMSPFLIRQYSLWPLDPKDRWVCPEHSQTALTMESIL
jgi:hypothetical protein